MNKYEAEHLAKKLKINHVLSLLDRHNIKYEKHRNGVHIQIKTNFGLAHVWPSTDKLQVEAVNYQYENHAQLITMIESLVYRPRWLETNN